ncbi:hypothetical protein P5G60_25095 [Paenibacillus jamilae]|nr:hypothetical protein [Paenibacillus jamilae]
MYDYDDFYDEPSEFDQKMEELKESLMDSVKQDHKDEVARLRKENAELQEVKRTLKTLQSTYEMKERELNREIKEAESKVRHLRLSTLLESFGVTLFSADMDFVKLPKCDKCDEKRRIHYKTPLGRESYERCTCDESVVYYKPRENTLTEFKFGRNREMLAWYKVSKSKSDSEDDYAEIASTTMLKQLYQEGMKFEDLQKHGVFFKKEEECQAYCDWLNEKRDKETEEAKS